MTPSDISSGITATAPVEVTELESAYLQALVVGARYVRETDIDKPALRRKLKYAQIEAFNKDLSHINDQSGVTHV